MNGASATPSRNRLRGVLIAMQVAASCVLIMLAVSAVRGVQKYVAMNPGIALDGLLSVELDRDGFGEDTAGSADYVRRIRALLSNEPGVLGVAGTSMLPLGNGYHSGSAEVAGKPRIDTELNDVDRDFFRAVGLEPLRGRVFDARDARGAEPVAVVNPEFVDVFGAGIVGQTVQMHDKKDVRVVGVVPNVAYHDPRERPRPLMYLANEQSANETDADRFVLRVPVALQRQVVEDLRKRVRAAFPDMAPPTIETMRDHTARQTVPQRIAGKIAVGIGAVELLLAAVGLYGLLMFALLAQTRELGVRLALGASGAQASWAIMQSGLRWAAWGVGAGLLVAIPSAFVAESALPGARATDPIPFALALLCVIAASVIAALGPARKASRVEPASVLRYD